MNYLTVLIPNNFNDALNTVVICTHTHTYKHLQFATWAAMIGEQIFSTAMMRHYVVGGSPHRSRRRRALENRPRIAAAGKRQTRIMISIFYVVSLCYTTLDAHIFSCLALTHLRAPAAKIMLDYSHLIIYRTKI